MTTLRTSDLHRFFGGQIEIQNTDGTFNRGEIRTAEVNERNEAVFTFEWMATFDGTKTAEWVANTDLTSYTIDLNHSSVGNVGPSNGNGGDRLSFSSTIKTETVMLFPVDGSKLDPSRVRGLETV